MDLGSKLNLKPGTTLTVIDVPSDVHLDLGENITVTTDDDDGEALLLFVADQSALEAKHDRLVDAAANDRLTWVAYPKGGQLGTDLNRDRLWELLGPSRIRPVRQVSIDDVWSALGFRPA